MAQKTEEKFWVGLLASRTKSSLSFPNYQSDKSITLPWAKSVKGQREPGIEMSINYEVESGKPKAKFTQGFLGLQPREEQIQVTLELCSRC